MPEQIDFFEKLNKLEPPAQKPIEGIETTDEDKPKVKPEKKVVKKVRMDENIPVRGWQGGWQSRYDGNVNDPDNHRKWKR